MILQLGEQLTSQLWARLCAAHIGFKLHKILVRIYITAAAAFSALLYFRILQSAKKQQGRGTSAGGDHLKNTDQSLQEPLSMFVGL